MGDIRVQDEQGNVHVFPDGSTREMIARAMNVKVASGEGIVARQIQANPQMTDDQFRAAGFSDGAIKQYRDPSFWQHAKRLVPGTDVHKMASMDELHQYGPLPGSFEGKPENIGQWVPSPFGREGIGGGVYDIAHGRGWKGGSEIISGVGNTLLPVTPFFAAGAPVTVASGAAGGYVGGKIGQGVAQASGASPELEQFSTDLGGLIGGLAGGVAPKAVASSAVRSTAGKAFSIGADLMEPAKFIKSKLQGIADRLNDPQLELFRNTPKLGDSPPAPATSPFETASKPATSPAETTGYPIGVETRFKPRPTTTEYPIGVEARLQYPIGVGTRFKSRAMTTGTGAFNNPVRPLNQTFDLLDNKLNEVHSLLDEAGIPPPPSPRRVILSGTASKKPITQAVPQLPANPVVADGVPIDPNSDLSDILSRSIAAARNEAGIKQLPHQTVTSPGGKVYKVGDKITVNGVNKKITGFAVNRDGKLGPMLE